MGNLKQKEVEELVAVSNKCLWEIILFEVPSKLEIHYIKRACIFYLILVGIPSSLTLCVKNRGDGRGGGDGFT